MRQSTQEHYPWPRFYLPAEKRRTRRLPLLCEQRIEVAAFSERNPRWLPMLALYDDLCRECGKDLYGSAIMGGGLVLATQPDVEHNEGVILIDFNPTKPGFTLEYRHQNVHPEQRESCSPEDVWERLRLYLAYKFGIRISKERNPLAEGV